MQIFFSCSRIASELRMFNHIWWKGNAEREIRSDLHFWVSACFRVFLFFQAWRGIYEETLLSRSSTLYDIMSVYCVYYLRQSDSAPSTVGNRYVHKKFVFINAYLLNKLSQKVSAVKVLKKIWKASKLDQQVLSSSIHLEVMYVCTIWVHTYFLGRRCVLQSLYRRACRRVCATLLWTVLLK